MSKQESCTNNDCIADVQSDADQRQIPINKVGIKDLRYPVIIAGPEGKEQATVADFNMYVNLPQDVKGTHMSRFIGILNEQTCAISISRFIDILKDMAERLEATSGHIEMTFPYFMKKTAPVSGTQSLMDYNVTFSGEIHDGVPSVSLKVVVPATSLCPCSKKISNYGAHNQRSHITVDAELNDHLWIDELITLIEQQASCEVYSLLKRSDEKFITEHAYDNPKFVEDMIRDVAAQLNAENRIDAYTLETENFESIHNHSAYAYIERDKRLD